MLETPHTRQLRELIEVRDKPCVSIFLPTHSGGPETRQDPIRMKNLLTAARRRLAHQGWSDEQIGDLLSPATALLDDRDFWRHLKRGLVIYLSPTASRIWGTEIELPEGEGTDVTKYQG